MTQNTVNMYQRRISKEQESKILKDILYGVAVADALGFPYQFAGRESRIAYPVIDFGITRDQNGSLHRLAESEIGYFSDDASLTLCLADSLKSGFDLVDIAQKMLMWLDDGYLSSKECAFDIGIQTSFALTKVRSILASGYTAKLYQLADNSDEYSNGNGALMRILPLISYGYHLDLPELFEITSLVCALTHPHLRSTLCCVFYLRYAEKLIDKEEKFSAFEQCQSEMKDFVFGLELSENEHKELYRLLHTDIRGLCSEVACEESAKYLSSSGYVVHTLEAALWCILTCDDFRQTVLQAINLGDDTDTTAAVAGGLAGILYGGEGMPREWIEKLKGKDLIEAVLS